MANRRIDYVLQHRSDYGVAETATVRSRFESLLCENGFLILKKMSIDNNCFTVLHCKEDCLQKQAEKMLLKMPLKEPQLDYTQGGMFAWLCNSENGCTARCASNSEQGLFHASSVFNASRAHVYKSYDAESNTLFGPATRTLLVHRILSEMDVRNVLPEPTENTTESDNALNKRGLPFLISKQIYQEAYPISGDYAMQFPNSEGDEMPTASMEGDDCMVTEISKFRLQWWKVFGFEFITRIREHFGETMAFYYAWVAVTMQFLVILSCFGIVSFAVGMWCMKVKSPAFLCGSAVAQKNTSLPTKVIANRQGIQDSFLEFVDEMIDNVSTLVYGLLLCLWGTCALEAWKRQSAMLANMWHVEGCIVSESVRPQFRDDAACQLANGRLCKNMERCSLPSWFLKVLLMLTVALGAGCLSGTVANTCFDLTELADRNYCLSNTSSWPVCYSLYGAAILFGVIAIYVLNRIYFYLARLLTYLENYSTEEKHSNALAIKYTILSAFNQFVFMYYVTFFQRNAATSTWWSLVPKSYGLHETPDNRCGRHDPCTPLLAYYFFGATIYKHSIEIITRGLLMPLLICLKNRLMMPLLRCLKKWCKTCLDRCCCTKCCEERCQDISNSYGCQDCLKSCCFFSISCRRTTCCCKCNCCCGCSFREMSINNNDSATMSLKEVIILEITRESADYWITENYLEKVLLLGHVMMFSVSMPLVTFLYTLVHVVAHILDTYDLLQYKRRPLPTLAQDIGIWKNVLQLMSVSGVVTTCILIGSMENHPFKIPDIDYLRYALIMTVVMLYLKGFVACHVSKVPSYVVNAQRKERSLLQNELRYNVMATADSSSYPLESPTTAPAGSPL